MKSKKILSEDDLSAIEIELQKAIECHQANQLDEAKKYYQSVLNKNPDHGPACLNLGALLLQSGDIAAGLNLMNMAATQALSENNSGVLFFIGNIFNASGRLIEAKTAYRQVLEIDPSHVEAHCNLAVTLSHLGRLNEAEKSYQQALHIQPDHLGALNNLGILLREAERLNESEALYQSALLRKPDSAALHYNLGITLKEAARLHEAQASFQTALQIEPNFADARSYLGSVLAEMGHLEEAQTCYRHVLQLKPDSDMAHFSLGLVLLSAGCLSEGWKKFEHRWKGGLNKSRYPATALSQWQGQTPQSGENILIFEEQGWGDKLQFSRYLNLLTEQFSGKVSMVLDRNLMRLFRRSFPDCEFLESVPTDQQNWQWQCPLMSLPLACESIIDTIPNTVPYLVPSFERVLHFKNNIAQLNLPATTRKVGLVWKSTSGMINVGLRSLPFEQISSLFNQADTAWFSLQKEPGQDKQHIQESGQIIDWTEQFADFDDTAALIMNLDLVIAVDTSVAHLAGALGKPVWLLNRHASEWRWMRGREDSSWYPTMRIFTQRHPGDWDEVIRRVATALSLV